GMHGGGQQGGGSPIGGCANKGVANGATRTNRIRKRRIVLFMVGGTNGGKSKRSDTNSPAGVLHKDGHIDRKPPRNMCGAYICRDFHTVRPPTCCDHLLRRRI